MPGAHAQAAACRRGPGSCCAGARADALCAAGARGDRRLRLAPAGRLARHQGGGHAGVPHAGRQPAPLLHGAGPPRSGPCALRDARRRRAGCRQSQQRHRGCPREPDECIEKSGKTWDAYSRARGAAAPFRTRARRMCGVARGRLRARAAQVWPYVKQLRHWVRQRRRQGRAAAAGRPAAAPPLPAGPAAALHGRGMDGERGGAVTAHVQARPGVCHSRMVCIMHACLRACCDPACWRRGLQRAG